MDCRRLAAVCLPIVLLVGGTSARAGNAAEEGLSAAVESTPSPAKHRSRRSTGYSAPTLEAYQPRIESLAPVAGAAPSVATRPEAPAITEASNPFAKADTGSALSRAIDSAADATVKLPEKSRQLPAQEEALALASATAVPTEESRGAASTAEAEAKVERGVESGPMRLRVRKQALQMSLEIPFSLD